MKIRCTYVGSAEVHAKKFAGVAGAMYEGRGLYNKRSGLPIDMPQRDELCAPMVMSDSLDHVAPDGSLVTSKSHRREVCARNDWYPYERMIPRGERQSRPRGLVNERFAKKRGLKTSEAAQEWLANDRRKKAKGARLDIRENVAGPQFSGPMVPYSSST